MSTSPQPKPKSINMSSTTTTKTKERARAASLKGSFVGNYEILQTIGEGSFAKVKLARHRLTNQKVAIKVIDKTKMPDEYALKNMYREAQILRILDHPNLIKLFEVMETKRNLFLILEYAAGGEFLEFVVGEGRVGEEGAKRFTRQIISALEHAHGNNIVHRDLKAENFLLDSQMNLKLSDFGLSNFFDSSHLLETCCGSPVYSAPELIEGRKYTGPEVDAWSLGINLYAMVVGDLPFADANLSVLYESILKGKYKMPDFVSSDCRDLISKLLNVNPKKRPKISQLKDHPWFGSSGNTTFLDPLEVEEVVPFRPREEEKMDQKVLEVMEQMGLDKKTTIQSVITGKFNQAAGLYYLLTYHLEFGISGEEFRLSSLLLQNSGREEPQDDSKAKGKDQDISEELANVLFRVERMQHEEEVPVLPEKEDRKVNGLKIPVNGKGRQRASSKGHADRPITPSSPQKVSHATTDQVVPLPHIAGATDTQRHNVNPNNHGQVNIAQLKANAGLDQTTREYTRPRIDSNATKFGIPKKNKKILIDPSLYQDDVPEKGRPRTIKFAFNCTCHNQLSPSVFFERLCAILDKNDIQWANDEFLADCEWGDLSFEVEICKLPRQAACGLRMKRVNGDVWEWKKLSAKISSVLDSEVL